MIGSLRFETGRCGLDFDTAANIAYYVYISVLVALHLCSHIDMSRSQ